MHQELIKECYEELVAIKQSIKEFANTKKEAHLSEEANLSLLNMYHYLKFRTHDSTALQDKLIKLGLSSLGRSQPHLLDSINQIIIILAKLQGSEYDQIDNRLDYDRAYEIMQKKLRIFGETIEHEPNRFATKIMITLPSEAAQNEKVIPKLYNSGASLFRINTAHDTYAEWRSMAHTIEALEGEKRAKIYVDLAGPKIRTGGIYKLKKRFETLEEVKVFVDETIIISGDTKTLMTKDLSKYNESVIVECTNKEAMGYVNIDDKIYIDDGKIELVTLKKDDCHILCRVTRAKESGTKIKQEKGINFPQSNIKLNAITEEDRVNVQRIVEFADIIGISFCQDEEDVNALRSLLDSLGKSDIGIVAKIETKRGVENLPAILHALIEHGNSAIMIARGDLAIEVGFENLSLIQEEILSLCEAAHMPIIYATQVLENMMKSNLPSRAEITDAAFAQRADCIMLNKGAYAENAIKILNTILKSMHKLFRKNRQLLSAETLFKF